ncbi:anti-sigma factor [Luteimonas sp. 22616]|uniref:anti-sigma factor n=1 Tax=Luteimonas sp. 22616 TaxID=3453951 RepID=UPI003F844735
MNIDHDHDHDAPLPDELRRSLRALRRDSTPAHDLWPGISARISADRQEAPAPPAHVAASPMPSSRTPASRAHRGRRSQRFAGLATAASLAAVLAIGWAVFMPSTDAPPPAATASTPMLREAAHMTREYRTAWRAFDARRPAGVDTSALHEIDRNAAQVRAALHQDPDARYLFERLQSLYALRLDLSRRLATLST